MSIKSKLNNEVLTDAEIIQLTQSVAHKLNYNLISTSTDPNLYNALEYWRPIEEYHNKYYVSNLGRIKNAKGKIIKLQRSDRGYTIFTFNDNGKTTRYIHHLVMAAFGDHKPAPYYQIDHIDGNKLNNCIANLEWVTPSENTRRAYQNHLKTPSGAITAYKIDIDSNNIMMTFDTITDASLVTGDSVYSIRTQKTLTNKGYRWRIDIAS